MPSKPEGQFHEVEFLRDLRRQPFMRRIGGYLRLSGPGYMQSAMTLGAGTLASCVLMGSLWGYELLWVQPMAMVLGYFVLAALAKQTTQSGEKSYDTFWNRLHPSLAILWAGSALVATLIWHIPQYAITANGVVTLTGGVGLSLDSLAGRAVIGAVLLVSACIVVYLYNTGARGLRIYETAVKILVWSVVLAFAVVALATGIQWKAFLLGITGISFLREAFWGAGVPPDLVKPIVGGIAAAVGINQVFLYPYSLLNRNWGREHKELAYFDLMAGMVVPFVIATCLIIIAVANTIGPAAGGTGEAVRDIQAVVPVLSQTLGDTLSLLILGLGISAIGFSTIITHMLASGFIGCELFGFDYRSRAKVWFSLLPAIGVVGVGIKFPWYAAVTASTLAVPLMPVTVIGFIILLNSRSFMGSERPTGKLRLLWNTGLVASVVVLTLAAYFGLERNWGELKAQFLVSLAL